MVITLHPITMWEATWTGIAAAAHPQAGWQAPRLAGWVGLWISSLAEARRPANNLQSFLEFFATALSMTETALHSIYCPLHSGWYRQTTTNRHRHTHTHLKRHHADWHTHICRHKHRRIVVFLICFAEILCDQLCLGGRTDLQQTDIITVWFCCVISWWLVYSLHNGAREVTN